VNLALALPEATLKAFEAAARQKVELTSALVPLSVLLSAAHMPQSELDYQVFLIRRVAFL